MDQINVSLIETTKILHDIKWLIGVLVLLAVTGFVSSEPTIVPSPATSPQHNPDPVITLHLLIMLVCLLSALLLICFFFFFIRRYAANQLVLAAATEYRGQQSSMKMVAARGLDPAVIATFTTFTYSTVKEIKVGQHMLECAVCLNEFQDHETLRLLPECSHVFHHDCIDEWLGLHVTCPVCRASLVPQPDKTASCCGPNGPTKSHVSIEVNEVKHDILSAKKVSRSYSMGYSMMQHPIGNVERYTLRLPEEVRNVLDNLVNNLSTSPDVMLSMDSSMKKSLKSASANFVRGSDYFDYERLKTTG